MNLNEFKKQLSDALYTVFGDVQDIAVLEKDCILEIPMHGLKIYKNNGTFLVYFADSKRFESDDPVKVLWHIGEEIARTKIYAATVSG